MVNNRQQASQTPVLILGVLMGIGLLVRLWGALPIIPYVSDPQIVREALQLGIIVSGSDFNAAFQAFKYPLVLPYILAVCYGVVFVVGRLIGEFASLAAFQEFLFADVTLFHMIAASVVAILNTLMIPVVYFVGKHVYNARKGLLAAALVTFSLINVQLAHQARPHAAVTFFLVLAFFAAVLMLEHGTWRHYVFAGVMSGLAAGTLHNGFLAFGFFFGVHIIRWFRAGRPANLGDLLSRPLLLGTLSGVLVVLLAYPHLIIAPDQIVRLETGGELILSGHHDMRADSWALGRVWDRFLIILNYEPIIVLLGLPGIVYGFFRVRERALHGLAVGFVIFYFLLFAPFVDTESRFFAPIPPFLGLMAANLTLDVVSRVTESLNSNKARYAFVAVIAGLLLLPGVVMTARLNWLFTRDDTRLLATTWVAQHAASDDPIVLDADLAVTPSQASLAQQVEAYPGSLGAKDHWLLGLTEDVYPQPNFDIYRLWIYVPMSAEELEALVPNRQSALVIFVNRTTFPREDWRYVYITANAEPVTVFSPISAPDRFGDSPLPADMSRALRDLWAVDRPGPIVEIYRLPVNLVP